MLDVFGLEIRRKSLTFKRKGNRRNRPFFDEQRSDLFENRIADDDR